MRKYLIFAAMGLAACGSDKKVNPSDPNSAVDNPTTTDPNHKDPTTPVVDGIFGGPAEAVFMGRGFPGDGGTGTAMAWAGSRITARVSGTDKVTIGLKTSNAFNQGGVYFNVAIDGGTPTRFKLDNTQAQTSFDVALADKNAHVVQWTKVSEPAWGLAVFATVTPGEGGTLQATPTPKNRRIEFIGDSIVNGYGVLGQMTVGDATTACNGNSTNTDADQSFATLTAKGLNADYTLIAYSGRGLATNLDGTTSTSHDDGNAANANDVMPAMMFDARPPSSSTPTPTPFDTTKFTPDVVVINLGTNDFSAALRAFIAGGGTSATCSATTCNPDATAFKAAYTSMLQALRSKYADAYIVCTTGPMLSDNYPSNASQHTTLQQYVNDTLAALADPKISAFDFGIQDTTQPVACDAHPSKSTHQSMATALEAHIKSKTGWN